MRTNNSVQIIDQYKTIKCCYNCRYLDRHRELGHLICKQHGMTDELDDNDDAITEGFGGLSVCSDWCKNWCD